MKIYSQNNTVFIDDTLLFEKGFTVQDIPNSDELVITSNTVDYYLKILWQEIQDENGSTFGTLSEVLTYLALTLNLDESANQDNLLFFISSIDDLPAPVAGVITLANEDKAYYLLDLIDLEGNTLRLGTNAFEGASQEIGGFHNGNIECLETCTIRSLRFDQCTMLINNNLGAFDWHHINFYNCAISVQAADNLLLETTGFLEDTSLTVTGTVNSLILSPNCIFRSATANNHTYFKLESTAVINRRLRIGDTPFVTGGNATATCIEVVDGATIPTESFEMRNVVMSGAGVGMVGFNGNDSQARALFRECRGLNIVNTEPNALYTMQDNATPTVVLLATPTKALGTTVFGSISQLFDDNGVSNRARYIGIIPRTFRVTMVFSLSSGNNNQIGCYIAKNGAIIEESEIYATTSGAGRAENVTIQAITTLTNNQYIELFVENNTSATNITVSELSVIVTRV